MEYVIAVQAPAITLSARTFAVESSFAAHLRELKNSLGSKYSVITLVAPSLPVRTYKTNQHHMSIMDTSIDSVRFVAAFPSDSNGVKFWLRDFWLMLFLFWSLTGSASVVHSGMSYSVKRPMLAALNLISWIRGKSIIFVTDIDYRKDIERAYKLGAVGRAKFYLVKYVADPFRSLQIRFAVKRFSLVLLKSDELVSEFGKGAPHVKNFYNTVHSADGILNSDELRSKVDWIEESSGRIELCYFGRLIWRKGVQHMLEAVCLAKARGVNLHFTIIGDGDYLQHLLELSSELEIEDEVTFKSQVVYGSELFDILTRMHLSLYAPLAEDTPRSAFDSMARGLPILSFDTSYFRDLSSQSSAVELATWPSTADLCNKIVELQANRSRLAEMSLKGVEFAKSNTQLIWMERRAMWTSEFVRN